MLPLLRTGGIPAWDTIWIEDSVFIGQANADGGLGVLFRSYSGYLQLVIRLLALPTSVLPVGWLAAYAAVAATTLVALLAAFVYRQLDGLVGSVASRLVVAAMVVLSPAMAIETTATITNTIWPILAAAPFAFLSRRERGSDVAMRSAVAFLAATATALGAVFVPFAIGCAIARRTRASATVAATYAVGMVLQLLVVRVSPSGPRDGSSLRILADLFGLRVLGSFLVGERPLDALWTGAGEVAVVVLVAVVGALLAYLLWGAGRPNQILAVVLIAYAVVIFVVPALGRGTDAIGFDLGEYSLNMTRYTVAPVVALVAAVAVLVDPGLARRPRALPVDGPKVFAVWAILVLAAGFFYPTLRGEGPAWRAEVGRAFADECDATASDAVVRVTTTPQNFSLELSCRRLAP